jgi:hypothetical protein
MLLVPVISSALDFASRKPIPSCSIIILKMSPLILQAKQENAFTSVLTVAEA